MDMLKGKNIMISLCYCYPWKNLPEEMFPLVFAEFKANGCGELVLKSELLERIMKEPSFLLRLIRMADRQSARFTEAHGIWGPALGLGVGIRFKALIPGMLSVHKQAMAYAADAGCRTYTIHMGAYEHIYFGTSVEESSRCAADALNELLPEAEKLGIILAVENNCDNPGSADVLAPFLARFDSKFLGCCFDVGHAHILEPSPGKSPVFYDATGIERKFCADSLEKLAPHIVTAHLHDNDGIGDWHRLPGKGNIDWKNIIPRLKRCPRILSLQAEVEMVENSVSVAELVKTFQQTATF